MLRISVVATSRASKKSQNNTGLVECACSGFEAFSHYPWLLVAKFGMHCPVFLFIYDMALIRVAHYSYPSTFACSRKSWVR
jgi:hypothetical protein